MMIPIAFSCRSSRLSTVTVSVRHATHRARFRLGLPPRLDLLLVRLHPRRPERERPRRVEHVQPVHDPAHDGAPEDAALLRAPLVRTHARAGGVPLADRPRVVQLLMQSPLLRSRLACRPQYACTQNTPHRHAIKTTRKHPKKNKDASLDPARETAPPDASFRPILGSKGVRFRDGPRRARSGDRRSASRCLSRDTRRRVPKAQLTCQLTVFNS